MIRTYLCSCCLFRLVDSDGWPTLNAWLAEYKRLNNTSMLMEMLELLQKLPVTIAALKKVCVRMHAGWNCSLCVDAVYVHTYVCVIVNVTDTIIKCMCPSMQPTTYLPVSTMDTHTDVRMYILQMPPPLLPLCVCVLYCLPSTGYNGQAYKTTQQARLPRCVCTCVNRRAGSFALSG